MKCPLCSNELTLRSKSIADNGRDVYFCTGCPMVYMLLRDHEKESIRKKNEVMEMFGGRSAFLAS